MGEMYPRILKKFEGDFQVPDRNGVEYLDHLRNLMRPITRMDWFKNEDAPADVYDKEMDFIKDEIADVDKRIKNSRSGKEIDAYKDLKAYLHLKEQTLNLRFDKPVNDPNIKNAIKSFMKKNGKLGLLRFKKWVKSHFPEVVTNIVGAGGMANEIYEIAENMGKGIIERGDIAKIADKIS